LRLAKDGNADLYTVPDIAEIDRITALSDPVSRNLQITQCYFELSAALLERSGPNANWCTFATWASRQAGQSIRQEDLARALETYLKSSPGPALAAGQVAHLLQRWNAEASLEAITRAIWGSLNISKAIARSSEAVGEGNRKVFAEIGREFARFQEQCLGDPEPDPLNLEGFCDELRPGEPPDGQDYLRQAFSHLYAAIFESEAKRRAELMLLANLEIGYHEQTRLQPEIQAALEDPFLDELQYILRLTGNLFPRSEAFLLRSRMVLTRLLGRPPLLELAIRSLLAVVVLEIREFLTETMMSIHFPEGIRLSPWSDLSGEYPVSLQHLTDPDLCQLIAEIDPTPDSLLRSGAVDWANMPERLHFIVELFRLYQESPGLFEPPFTPDQVLLIKAGQVPAGNL
jgi:hypothetical protein